MFKWILLGLGVAGLIFGWEKWQDLRNEREKEGRKRKN